MEKSLRGVLESDEEVTLVLQGGGMRGVYGIGVLTELEKAGYQSRFQNVIGTSAGALHGAYFLSGQSEDGVRIYTDFLSGKRFINFSRYYKILDIDYLVDDIICSKIPLDEDRLSFNPATLWIPLTSTQGDIVWKTHKESWHIAETLRAAAAMPIAYRKAVRLGNEEYLDGGTKQSFHLSYALEQGAKNIVLVLTRPIDYPQVHKSFLENKLIRYLGKAAGHSKEVISNLLAPDYSFEQTRETLLSQNHNLWVIAPKESLMSRFTRDRDTLRYVASVARQDAQEALGVKTISGLVPVS